MTDPSRKVEEVVKGLTEAQRRAVSSATWSSGDGAWHPRGWYCYADKRVRRGLCSAGVMRCYLNPRQRLTPLGLEVRRYLESKSNG